ncbi:hypothetical protein F4777DRAFT_575589 [Nemania sp. FL0916]|nr:hypothetical protein F4777DRAFT_575589 [Nemania sp. FL0916]
MPQDPLQMTVESSLSEEASGQIPSISMSAQITRTLPRHVWGQRGSFGRRGLRMPRIIVQNVGSHNVNGIRFMQCGVVTMGNTTDDDADASSPTSATHAPSHNFIGVRLAEADLVHFGNVGIGHNGHIFTDTEIQGAKVFKMGDFANRRLKREFVQAYKDQANGSTEHQTDGSAERQADGPAE